MRSALAFDVCVYVCVSRHRAIAVKWICVRAHVKFSPKLASASDVHERRLIVIMYKNVLHSNDNNVKLRHHRSNRSELWEGQLRVNRENIASSICGMCIMR